MFGGTRYSTNASHRKSNVRIPSRSGKSEWEQSSDNPAAVFNDRRLSETAAMSRSAYGMGGRVRLGRNNPISWPGMCSRRALCMIAQTLAASIPRPGWRTPARPAAGPPWRRSQKRTQTSGSPPSSAYPARSPAEPRALAETRSQRRCGGHIRATTRHKPPHVVSVHVLPDQTFAKRATKRLQKAAKRNAVGSRVERG